MNSNLSQIAYRAESSPYVPRYGFSKITPIGGQAITIDTSAKEAVFELPSKCVNFSRSYVRFTSTPTTGGAAANMMFNETMTGINKVQLSTLGGLYLTDTTASDHYLQVALKERHVSKVPVYESHTANVVFGSAQNGVIVNDDYLNVDHQGELNSSQFYSHAGAAGAGPVQERIIPLGDFRDTILALDKDLPFTEITQLKITFNPYANWGHRCTAVADPVTGAAPLAGDIALTGITLYLAVEQDTAIIQELYGNVNKPEGFNMAIPWTYYFKNSDPAEATSRVVSIKMNRTHGRHLQKVYHIPYNGGVNGAILAETLNNRYLHTSTDVSSFITYVDNDRRQPYDVVLANGDDWALIKDGLKGTQMERRDRYRSNWFIKDVFDGNLGDNETLVADVGLSLDTERKLDLTLNSEAVAHKYYIYSFAVVTRNLLITPHGIVVV